MKISIVVPDISSNAMGATLNLARMLDGMCQVDVVGPDFGRGVNPMYAGAWDYRIVECPNMYRVPEFWRDICRIERALDGDMIIAMKAYMNTILPSLRTKKRRRIRAVAYLDEWDGAQFCQLPWPNRIRKVLHHWHHPLESPYCRWAERYIPQFDLVLSTTAFLQDRFGGAVLPFGVDTDVFVADQKLREAVRTELGLKERIVVLFGGVVREHKGLHSLMEAVRRLQDRSVCLLIVGPKTEMVREWLSEPSLRHLVYCTGAVARDDMPRYLNAGDIIAVPLSQGLLASSQMPCKVYEAMATGKPVIANDVSDLARVIGDGGWVTPPGSVGAWEQALHEVIQNPEEAKRRGALARERCRQRYDKKIIQKQLLKLVEPLMP